MTTNLTRFSTSPVFHRQQDFYLEGGESVWTGNEVPYAITTNSFIANAYARTLHSYLLHLNQKPLDQPIPNTTIYIIELAAGKLYIYIWTSYPGFASDF